MRASVPPLVLKSPIRVFESERSDPESSLMSEQSGRLADATVKVLSFLLKLKLKH
jgi:hypothetical protein